MRNMLLIICLIQLFSVRAQKATTIMLGNYHPVCIEDPTVKYCDSLPEDLSEVDVIMFFSGSTSQLNENDMNRITKFLENGGGLYLGADNQPFQSEANQVTRSLYKKECFGEFEDTVAISNTDGGNLQLKEFEEIPAGKTTVAFPMDYRLKVEAWVSDEPLILSGSWEQGRVIIDGGYSRFYCNNRSGESDQLLQRFLHFLRFN